MLDIIKDENLDLSVRFGAAIFLRHLGEAGVNYIPDILKIISNKKLNLQVRYYTAQAFENTGEAGAKYIPDFLQFIKNEEDERIRRHILDALKNIRQLELKEITIILNLIYENESSFKLWRYYTYLLGGGTEEIKTLLTWLGKPEINSVPKTLTREEAKKTLDIFLKIWQFSQDLPELQKDLAEKIVIVAAKKQVSWQRRDISLLQKHQNNLKNSRYANKAGVIESVIDKLKR